MMNSAVTEIMLGGMYTAIFLSLFSLGEFIRRKFPRNPECSRKTVHFLGGIAAMSFPYVLSSHWTVLVLTAGFCLVIAVTKHLGVLESVHGVGRHSSGAVYYPLAVYLIFFLARGHPVLYLTSILVMTVSDTCAALAGGRYGAVKYDAEGNFKSLEGSVVFFFLTFLCVHLPLLLMTDISRIDSVLIAVILAVLVTGFEAISLSGSDNLIVPFGTFFILMKMTRLPHAGVMESLYYLLGAVVITWVLSARLHLFRLSGLVAMMLLNYAALSLCNVFWFFPLVLAQTCYYVLMKIFAHYEGAEQIRRYQVRVIFYLGLMPAIILFAANMADNPLVWYLPYVTAISVQVAIVGRYFISRYVSRMIGAEGFFQRHRWVLSIVCALTATFWVAGFPVAVYVPARAWHSFAVVLFGTWAAYAFHFIVWRAVEGAQNEQYEYPRRFISAALGVACVMAAQCAILTYT
ncbi:MAG: hypothetical protein GF333_06680 [Candidatus Omnitrophica bacterium]|nr:hypothetical protein [Candidatus Omnitrophota bacterium]